MKSFTSVVENCVFGGKKGWEFKRLKRCEKSDASDDIYACVYIYTYM